MGKQKKPATEGAESGGDFTLEEAGDEQPEQEQPVPSREGERRVYHPEEEPYELTDEDLDKIAEVITVAQIDRLLKLRSQIDRRDAYRAKGIDPRSHIVVISGVTHIYKGKRHESKPGDALEIAHLDAETHDHLIEKELAERPV